MPKKHAKKGNLFDDGYGDFRIDRVVGPGEDFPIGTKVPIPEVPGFDTLAKARAYIRDNPDTFANLQVQICRVCDLIACSVKTETKLTINYKPRFVRDNADDDSQSEE